MTRTSLMAKGNQGPMGGANLTHRHRKWSRLTRRIKRTNFWTDKNLHGSAFHLHGTRGTAQVFSNSNNKTMQTFVWTSEKSTAIWNRICKVPCQRFAQVRNSPVQKFVQTQSFFFLLLVIHSKFPPCIQPHLKRAWKKDTPHQLLEGLIDDSWHMIACTQTMFSFFSTRENRGSVNRIGLLNLLEPNKSNIQNRSGSFCEKRSQLRVVIRCGSWEITCKWQNQSFASNKHVSQGLYQIFEKTKMNFKKLLG